MPKADIIAELDSLGYYFAENGPKHGMGIVARAGNEIRQLRKKLENDNRAYKCQSCGTPISRDCNRCEHLWQT